MNRLLPAATASLILAATLAGCAISPSMDEQMNRAEFERTIPTCDGEQDCNAKWEAAQLWVVHNAGFKIQTATNVLIETYNAVGGSSSIAARVTKEPLGGGRYKIVVRTFCDNMFGCTPVRWIAAFDFNRTVGAAKP